MKKKISIVTSGHSYLDERIFYKFARSLNKSGYEVSIICSTVENTINTVEDDIHIIGFNGSNLKKSEKVNKFTQYLINTNPDVIICCEPLPILAANKFRKRNKKTKIIYDVTEWYPENVAFKLPNPRKLVSYVSLFLFNIYVANTCDAIVVGEASKKKRYDVIAPFKQKSTISYYPVLEFFKYSTPVQHNKSFTLCYAGLLKLDRGIITILDIAQKLAFKHPEFSFRLKLLGRFESKKEESIFEQKLQSVVNLKVEIIGWQEYPNISENLFDVDICLDLREDNFVYKNSLPIKLFEYMACGKPFVFSDIWPIRKEIEFENCGILVNPNNLEEIVEKIEAYFKDHKQLREHGINARKLVEEKYNWERESIKLLELIDSI